MNAQRVLVSFPGEREKIRTRGYLTNTVPRKSVILKYEVPHGLLIEKRYANHPDIRINKCVSRLKFSRVQRFLVLRAST